MRDEEALLTAYEDGFYQASADEIERAARKARPEHSPAPSTNPVTSIPWEG